MNAGYFNHSPKPELWGIDLQAGLTFVGSSFTDTKTFATGGNIALSRSMAGEIATQLVDESGIPTGFIRSDAIKAITDSLTGKRVGVRFQGPTAVGSTTETVNMIVTSSPNVTVGAKSYDATGRSAGTPISGTGLDGLLGIPLFYPQFNIGTAAGTQIAFRGFPGSLDVEGLGEISFWGLGINHNPGYWNDKENYLPLGINSSVTATYTSLSIGDNFSWSGWSLGVMASRRVGFRFLNLTPYAGLGMEGSTLELKYQYDAGVPGVPPWTFPSSRTATLSSISMAVWGCVWASLTSTLVDAIPQIQAPTSESTWRSNSPCISTGLAMAAYLKNLCLPRLSVGFPGASRRSP